ncbi:MAG: hypothetical protein U1E83_05300 [Methylotetracoccus sp.]
MRYVHSRSLAANLTPKQTQAAFLIASGIPQVEVAKQVNVSTSTLSLWKRIDIFRATINAFQKEILEQLRAKMAVIAQKATERLEELLDSEDPKVKLDAIKMVYANVPLFSEAPEKYIGPTDRNEVFRKRELLGDYVLPPDTRELRLAQSVTVLLEDYQAGNLTKKELDFALGVSLSKKDIDYTLDDPDALMSVVDAIVDSEPRYTEEDMDSEESWRDDTVKEE